MNVLITGITGFTGSHLAEYLLKKKYNVFGTVRGRCRQTEFIDNIKDNLTLLECDLTDMNSIMSTLDDCVPDLIFHLAAQSFVPTSWRAPQETFNTNALGTLNLLEAIRKSVYDPKIQVAGSSEEYGMVYEDEVPIKETNPLRPLSPYAVSKVAQDLLGYQYYKSYGLKIVRTRGFNLIGPRSGGKIFSAAFAKQILKSDIVKVGNLDAIRDLVDVRDICRGYYATITKGDYGEVYNVSTGKGWQIKQILDMMIELSNKEIKIEKDKSLMRPSDVPILVGDYSKLHNKTGWKPKYDMNRTLNDVLDYWRKK